MAIVCRQCGRHNVDGAQFCANPDCGAYLPWGGGQAGPMTQPAPVVGGATTIRPPDAQNAAASLTLADATLSVVPGETAATTATIHNGGTQVEQFAVRVLGPAAPWVTVEPALLTVYPSSRGECTVRFAPPRRPDTAPGRAWFTVRATSVLHPGLTVGANGTLDVAPFRVVGATLTPQGTTGRWRTIHSIEVTNTGNLTEPVTIRADDQAGKLRFAVPAGEVPIPPGKHQINVPVRPRMRLLGRPQPYPFRLTVTPRPPVPPIPLDGNREAVPLIAGWVPKVVTGLVVLALAATALLLARNRLPMFTTAGGPSAGASAAVPDSAAVAPPVAASAAGAGGASSAPPSMGASSPAPVMHLPQRFEAESLLDTATATGGAQVTTQASGCCGLLYSGGAQVFVQAPAGGAALSLKFDVAVAGRYALLMGQTMGPNFGFTKVQVDGQDIGDQFNGYFPTPLNAPPQLQGVVRLRAGTHTLKLVILTRDASATGYNAGLDFFDLARSNATGGPVPSVPPASTAP